MSDDNNDDSDFDDIFDRLIMKGSAATAAATQPPESGASDAPQSGATKKAYGREGNLKSDEYEYDAEDNDDVATAIFDKDTMGLSMVRAITSPPPAQPAKPVPPTPLRALRSTTTPPPLPRSTTTQKPPPLPPPLPRTAQKPPVLPPPQVRRSTSPPPPPPNHTNPNQPSTAQSKTEPLQMPAARASSPPTNAPTANAPTSSTTSAPLADIPKLPFASDEVEEMPIVATRRGPRWLGKGWMLAVLFLGVFGLVIALMMSLEGTIVVNVSNAKGSTVSRLEVYVDGTKRCDTAPCILTNIPVGVHQVKLLAQGFEPPAERGVTIEWRKSTTLDFTLVTQSAGTGFKAASTQPGVELTVNGKSVGSLPQEIRDLSPGDYKLQFSGYYYAPLNKTVTITPNEMVDLGDIVLKVVKGAVTIELDTPGAKVTLVSGTNRKELSDFHKPMEFDANAHWQLEATKSGFENYVQAIRFDDGQAEKTIVIKLNPKSP
ncbi:MAG: PEGA domain-containing protein [Polyangiaceae bacterium]|nr:PEGA domain-containing protein [Polyangiaceae bacterium]